MTENKYEKDYKFDWVILAKQRKKELAEKEKIEKEKEEKEKQEKAKKEEELKK